MARVEQETEHRESYLFDQVIKEDHKRETPRAQKHQSERGKHPEGVGNFTRHTSESAIWEGKRGAQVRSASPLEV